MDLRQLRHFVTVARFASFSKAADNLRLTQAALSKSIRTLEHSLGVRLLDRSPSGVRVTVFGERLLGYGKLLLSLSEEAVEEIDGLRGARRGTLHVGGLPTVMRIVIPEAVVRFTAARPDVSLVVHDGLNDTLIDALFAGKLDVAITAKPLDVVLDDIEWRALHEEPIHIVASRDHPLAGSTDLHLADLADYSWVVPPRSEPDRLKLDALFVNAGLPKPRIVCETTSVVFLTALLGRTHHLSYLTASNLQAPSKPFDLVPLAISEPTWTRTTCAVFRRKGIIRPTVLAFYNEVERAYGSLKSQGGV